jgi:PAS domain S-box-containing protein
MQLTAPTLERPEGPLPTAGDARDLVRSAVEWLPIGVVVADDGGMIVIVNREAERLFGYEGGELIGQSIDVLVPDGARADHAALRRGFTAQPHARAMAADRELFGRRKDGSEVPIEIGLTPIPMDGSPLVLASVVDLTARRRVQSALEERLTVECRIAELAAEFVNLRPEDVDRALQGALRRLVRTLGFDRSALFQVDENGDFVHTHQSTRRGCPPPLPRISAAREFPWHLDRIRAGAVVIFDAVEDVPDAVDRESLRRLGTKSGATFPLSVAGQTWGALSFSTVREARSWPPDVINGLRLVALIVANALARRRADEQLRRTVDAMTVLRDRLRDENRYLRDELQRITGPQAIVGHSPAVRRTLELVREAAATDAPVLLTGETGTGKALLASRIHDLSARRERTMVRVDCAATTTWIDGRLFAAGPDSSANEDPGHVGRLDLAKGSTVFFDEIADLSLSAQKGLADRLQDGQIQVPGRAGPVKVDVRIIAATCRNLKRCVEEGTFRKDLYHALKVFSIHIPPLRERREDIPVLVWRFVDELSTAYRRPIEAIDQASMTALQRYSWPGNARELRHVVEHAMAGSTTRRLHIQVPSNGSSTRRRKAFTATRRV